ncbi:MAG: phosphatidate cytidylyltransferase [Deltaproteobacteria bacterium]|nr:phosphatidate cytidylyltransferase [Deltaproteobacteria bacterium]
MQGPTEQAQAPAENSHRRRILTSIVLLPVLGGILFWGGSAFVLALIPVSCLGLWELYGLVWGAREEISLKWVGTILTASTMALLPWLPREAVLPWLLFWALATSAVLFLARLSRDPATARMEPFFFYVFGLVYVPGMLGLFWFLDRTEVVLVLLAAFATDTGGFYCGRFWGRSKIWPAVSPKKTWEGSLGGMGLTVAVCVAFGLWIGTSVMVAVFFGIILNLGAQLGDFFESGLKRWAGKKDSGPFLPGHGGILDRIDSILFCLPVYLLARAFHPFH